MDIKDYVKRTPSSWVAQECRVGFATLMNSTRSVQRHFQGRVKEATVRFLINEGVEINSMGCDKLTTLAWACAKTMDL
ncbi:uncharacterized protein BDV17DRAFT_235126 [Aspergillus undulatus]|uniref:uncharacterized protein n=1 Tax=Aspergillus undulatus TaxID=1810928 RepID=UPI003CCD5109